MSPVQLLLRTFSKCLPLQPKTVNQTTKQGKQIGNKQICLTHREPQDLSDSKHRCLHFWSFNRLHIWYKEKSTSTTTLCFLKSIINMHSFLEVKKSVSLQNKCSCCAKRKPVLYNHRACLNRMINCFEANA